MKALLVVSCVLGVALAFPSGSSWRRAAEEQPDRDVEVVEPVRRGGSQMVPFGLGGFGLRGLEPRLGDGYGGYRPGRRDSLDSDEDSGEDVPGGYVPTGFLHPYFVNPMSNFMAQMAEMMNAMRREMNQVLNRLPSEGNDFSKLGNTTSTTKVVDGHVITVNETVIGGEDGDDSVIHIRVVDLRPSEAPEAAGDKPSSEPEPEDASTAQPNRDENEIPMKVGSEVDDLNA